MLNLLENQVELNVFADYWKLKKSLKAQSS